MMSRYKHFFAAATVILTAILSLKANDSSAEAKALLYEAKDFTRKANFKSVMPVYKDGKLQKSINLYRMFAPDGTLLEKVENIWPDLLTEAYVSNKSGTYVFIGSSVMNLDASLGNRNLIYTSINEFYNEGASYSVTDDTYKDTPCYNVTVKLPTDQASIDELAVRFRNGSRDARKYISERFPFVKTYLVGKDNHFIYSCSFYNLKGEKTLSRDWGDVDFKTPIDENIFKTPQGNIAQLDKNSEKFRYIRRLFDVPNADLNTTKTSTGNLADESDKARDILFSAMKTTEKASFKATCKVLKGGKELKTINEYHMVMSDGTVLERSEYIWWNSWKETYLPGKDGAYVMIDKTLVKADFKIGGRKFIYKNVKNDVAEDASYSLSEADYKGIPCYKVTVKIPTEPSYVKERMLRVQRYSDKGKDELIESLPFAKVFFIGKKNNFIYSCTYYNILGKRTKFAEWGNVKFNPTMDVSLFDPPKGVPVITAKTPKKFDQIKERCIALFKAAKR